MLSDTLQATLKGLSLANDATLLDVLARRTELTPDALAYCHLVDGETDAKSWSYAQLARHCAQVAQLVQDRVPAGAPVLLVLEPGLLYVAALFGVLQAGAIAVQSFPPTGSRAVARLASIAADCGAELVIADERLERSLPRLQQALTPSLPSWLFLGESMLQGQAVGPLRGPRSPVALLQYTSGSTGQPKGVVLSHRNLVSNSEVLADRLATCAQPVIGFSWLPPYHDMGLMGTLLLAAYAGFPLHMMSPAHFVQRPLRWLEAVSRHRVTTSVAPNFALDLCVDHLHHDEIEGLDLSSLRMLFCGAEPVRPATLDRFTETFRPFGFDPKAFVPCYGLAEATLFITGKAEVHTPPRRLCIDANALAQGRARPSEPSERSLNVVSCGTVARHHRVRVIDPEHRVPVDDGVVGEIWFAGESVAGGYHAQPALSAATFAARLAGSDDGPYLRTGDLGFVLDGELYVTGRIKDLIIFAGRNLYPQDLEAEAEASHPAVRPNAVVTFSYDEDEQERVVVVAEIKRSARLAAEGLQQVVQAVRTAIAASHGVSLHAVRLVPFGSIPLTTSGKVQRRRTRELFLAGELKPIAPADPSRLGVVEAA